MLLDLSGSTVNRNSPLLPKRQTILTDFAADVTIKLWKFPEASK
jgi:hypothetical protein